MNVCQEKGKNKKLLHLKKKHLGNRFEKCFHVPAYNRVYKYKSYV